MTQRVVNYTYGTGNPVLPDGSIDVRDGIDNLQSFDVFLGAEEDTYNQRTGSIVKTLSGAIREIGIPIVGDFTTGCTVTASSQGVQVVGGSVYRWSGALPKAVPPNSTPGGTGGIYPNGDWVDVGDASLRGNLAETGGSKIVGFNQETVHSALSRGYNKLTDANTPVSNLIASFRSDRTTNVNLIPICDSFGDGVGAADYRNRFMKILEWSINSSNVGGFGFASDTRLTDAINVANSGITSNGTSTTQGALESRVDLADGQYIDVTGVQIDYADLWYDGGLTSGDVNIYVNGVLSRTFTTIKTSGVKTTFDAAKLNARTVKTDVVRFQASGGAVSVSALHILRGPSGGLWQAKVSHGGWSYKAFDNQLIVNEISYYAKWRGAYVVYALMLGTNSIYNAQEAQTPSEMVSSISSLINKLYASTPSCGFIIGVPPKAIETTWPVIKPGYTYENYVDALIEFGEAGHIQLVRFDTLNLLEKNLYSDGIHPTDAGHILYAKRLCDSIGIPCIPYSDDKDPVPTAKESKSPATLLGSWGSYLNNPAYAPVVRRVENIAYLSATVQANGSASLDVMTIPIEFAPKVRNINCAAWDIVTGTWTQKLISVQYTGIISIAETPSTFLSIEISWVIDNGK